MFDGDTVIHDEGHAGGGGPRAGRVVDDTELEPNQLRQRTQREGFVHHCAGQLAPAEDVHDVNGLILLRSPRMVSWPGFTGTMR